MDLVVDRRIGSIPAVSSKLVAQKFNKFHKDVIKAFRNLEKQCEDTDFFRRNFAPVDIIEEISGVLRVDEILMTRDGFALLVMGFTGREALVWKIAFIKAFNRLENEVYEDNVRLRNENQDMAKRIKPLAMRMTKAIRRTVANVAGDLLGGVTMSFSTKPLFEMTEWQQDIAHIPAMLRQAETLHKHVVERMEAARSKFLAHMRGLGLDAHEADETFREAVRVMCRGQDLDATPKLPN